MVLFDAHMNLLGHIHQHASLEFSNDKYLERIVGLLMQEKTENVQDLILIWCKNYSKYIHQMFVIIYSENMNI